jgi:polygalacturonase
MDGGHLARVGRPLKLPLASALLALSSAAGVQALGSTCDVTRYGAKADAKTLATGAIQRAIDDCAAAGGGIVLLLRGTFLSGTLVLKDDITLRIAPGAVLMASPDIRDFTPYPPADVQLIAVDGSTQNKGNGPYHLIHATGARHIAIDGGGVIDGNGRAYWEPDPDKVFVSRRPRPSPLVELVQSADIRIEDVTFRNAAGWTIHPLESRDIRMSGVTIVNDPHGPNTDGIDIDSSSNVAIRDSNIDAGDDCVVLKTTGRRGGRPAPPTVNVIVSGLVCSSDDQGIKIGTETLGDIRDVLFSDILIYRSDRQYRPLTAGVSISMVDGSLLENVVVSNVLIRDAATPFFLRLGNRGRGQKVPVPGGARNIMLSNLVATEGTLASSITGIPGHPIKGVSLSNIRIIMAGGGKSRTIIVPEAPGDYPHAPMFGPLPASGLYARHVDGLALSNVQLGTATPDERPLLVLDDVMLVTNQDPNHERVQPHR